MGKRKALKTVAKGSAKMAGATLISRFLGLVREQVMAGLFGATGLSDAFFVAYRIPNLLRGLFAEGAFSSAFVPSFIQANQDKGDYGARQLLWRVFLSLGLFTAFLSVVVSVFSEQIVSLFVNDNFIIELEKFELAVKLTQIMSPYLCLTALAALVMGALNSYKSYFRPALAPAVFNISVIVSAIVLPKFIEVESGFSAYYAVAYGVVIGGVVQLLFQIPVLYKKGLRPVIQFEEWNKVYEKRIIAKMGPGVLGTAAQHMNLLVGTILATGSAVGAVSWLTYAFRLFQFPIGVIGVSIGNSFLVEFSGAVKSNDDERSKDIFRATQEISLLLLLPITLIGFFGADHLVKIVFERGQFGIEATAQTALALKCYIIGLPYYGYYKNLNSALYALERAKLPVIISGFSIGVSLLVSWLLIDDFGFHILALGNGAVFMLNAFLMAIAMKKIKNWGLDSYFSVRSIKLILISIFLFIAIKFFHPSIADPVNKLGSFIYLSVLSIFVMGAYGMMLLVFGETNLLRRVANKLKKR